MQLLTVITGLVLAVLLGLALYVRLAPSDPARWHADPATIPDPRSPNFARRSAEIALPLPEVAERLADRARRAGAVRLAGDAHLSTWVVRSRLMGFPDYVTIRLDETATGTRITALSRARFGHGDMGVNAARLDRWIDDLSR
ncbi:MAG: Protein of unknown function (DUF1499) [Rhodobacteraceae bacterium HLUCCA12]|nr:MAG: Protein of unknown function (DUF1499) [Rhodobacteraceae bacterium HLUCCA12]